MRKVFFQIDSLSSIAAALGCTKLHLRPSQHSFTGFVCECHFKNPEAALFLSDLIKEHTKQFTTVRITSPNTCYVSVPIEKPNYKVYP